MHELKKYIKDVLGDEIELHQLANDALKSLPMYLGLMYRMYTTKLLGKDIILMDVVNWETSTTAMLSKHIITVHEKFGKPIVLVIGAVDSYKRQRLIEKKIPFISKGKQMYIPNLLLDLKEIEVTPKRDSEFMQPAAQCLLLYHLQVEKLEGINLKTIAQKLNYGTMTITRAVDYLKGKGICTIEGTKDKYICFTKANNELWQQAEKLFTTPIKNSFFVSGISPNEKWSRTGISALAEYTDIAGDGKEYYAISVEDYAELKRSGLIKNSNKVEGDFKFEIWKYNPQLLSRNKFIDPLSLYLAYKNDTDERIEGAIDKLLKRTLW